MWTRGSTRPRRVLVPLAILALLAASCANHGDGAAGTETGGRGDSPTTAASGTSSKPGTFGTMTEAVCGPGDAKGATAQGVTDTGIKIGVTGDADNTLVPDLNKELYDASHAFVDWCNDAGGINGRKIELTEHDAGLLKPREAMTDACAQEFALVGGGLALDFQGVEVRVACGLTELPGFANSVDNRESAHQVQAVPAYKTQWPVTMYGQIAKAFPDAIAHYGLMQTSAQLGSGRPYDQRLMDAIGPLGYKSVYKGDLPPPPLPVDNWRPYVEEMKSKGVKVLDFEVTPELLVPLLRTMRDVGWYPDAVVLQSNFYNQALLDAGDALKNVYVSTYVAPFELADKNPPTKQFLGIMDAKRPDWKHAGLAVNSFSSWLLFAKAAKACGSQLTRDCLEQKATQVGQWDGGGLHAPANPDLKANPQQKTCGLMLKASADGFTVDAATTGANEGIFYCSPKNTAFSAL
jgi:ABC-type branched-subunit amino acid transport system substrate-binding protein